ncbi:YitT family protein [Metamycoplasma phocicerebrale]|uniref:YitT family protein n=2 Tax=Metamycoplasma phocicerebrale TaxID=142649 RepID=A0A3Q9V8Z6_9BACT|nr:YitT family protein [Metamycoplasma phocicerebrale]
MDIEKKNQIKSEEYKALAKARKNLKSKDKKPNAVFDLNPYNVNFFNVWKKFPKKMAFVFISAILYNIAIATFLAKAATVATGVSAIVQALTFTVSSTAPYFAYIYFALNLPLIIFYWKKNSRLFMILTTYWLLWQVLFQSILLIGPVGHTFNKISIFYVNWVSPSRELAYQNSFKSLIPWEAYGSYGTSYGNLFEWIKSNPARNVDGFYTLSNQAANELGYRFINESQFLQLKAFMEIFDKGFSNPTWPIIVYALIGATMAGIAGGIAWKNSASTAGGDFIVYYISRVKQKGVGHISTIVALFFGGFSIILIAIVELIGLSYNRPFNAAGLLLRILCSIAYVFVYTSFIELIFPKYRKVQISIYTKNPEKIIQHFKNIKYWHGYNIAKLIGGYTNTETIKIETFALYLEQSLIKNEVLLVDPSAWMTVTRVHNIIGKFNTSKVES